MKILVFFARIYQKISAAWAYANCYSMVDSGYVKAKIEEKHKCSGTRSKTIAIWRRSSSLYDDLGCRRCPFFTEENSH